MSKFDLFNGMTIASEPVKRQGLKCIKIFGPRNKDMQWARLIRVAGTPGLSLSLDDYHRHGDHDSFECSSSFDPQVGDAVLIKGLTHRFGETLYGDIESFIVENKIHRGEWAGFHLVKDT